MQIKLSELVIAIIIIVIIMYLLLKAFKVDYQTICKWFNFYAG